MSALTASLKYSSSVVNNIQSSVAIDNALLSIRFSKILLSIFYLRDIFAILKLVMIDLKEEYFLKLQFVK